VIEGVLLLPRACFQDHRGRVLRMVRTDDPDFAGFGEVYFSTVRHGEVKGWKLHTRMVLTLAAPMGEVLFVLYDGRQDSPTRGVVQTQTLGTGPHRLLRIPPGVWFGFQGAGPGESLVANCASIPHDPRESVSLPPGTPEIPYRWSVPA